MIFVTDTNSDSGVANSVDGHFVSLNTDTVRRCCKKRDDYA